MNMELAIANLTNSSNALVNNASGIFKIYETLELDPEIIHNTSMVVMPLFFGIFGIFGFIGNLLVVVVVAANPKMRSTTNILIINLAVADLLFIIFFIPVRVSIYVLKYWPFGDIWCKIIEYTADVTCYESIYTLVLMSLDRYLAVVHPIASMSWRKGNYAILAIGVVWVISLVLATPAFFTYSEYVFQKMKGPPKNVTVCVSSDIHNDDIRYSYYQVFFFLASYVLPLVLICIFYMSILIKLWRGARVSAGRQRGRRSTTKLIFVVISVLAICWGPGQVIAVIDTFKMYPLTTVATIVGMISGLFAHVNSCINPILYAFLNDEFRNAFRKIIYCRPRAEPNNRLGLARTMRAANTGNIP